MVELFGTTRDQWIESDVKGWLAPNRIYPGVAKAVRAALKQDEAYIVTTQQVRAGCRTSSSSCCQAGCLALQLRGPARCCKGLEHGSMQHLWRPDLGANPAASAHTTPTAPSPRRPRLAPCTTRPATPIPLPRCRPTSQSC